MSSVANEPTGATHRVDLIIPTYNGWELLAHCLQALRAQTYRDFAVLVVDDGSTDGTAELLQRAFPEVHLLSLAGNSGLATACNAGIAATGAPLVCLLNNDTEPEPRWLGALVAALDAAPWAGSAASKLLLFDRRDTLHSAGDGFTVTGLPVNHGIWQRDTGQYDAARIVFGPCAGAALYRRAALAHVSGIGGTPLDEEFFMYCEDVDLNWRLQLAGYGCIFAPDAHVYHRLSATGGGPFASYWVGRNLLLVLAKDVPRPLLRRYWARIVATYAGRAWRALRSWRGAAARATLRGMCAAVPALPHYWRKRRALEATFPTNQLYGEHLLLDRKRR